MTSPADASTLLAEMLGRIETIERLAQGVGESLRRGDESAIEDATARLETLLVEYRLLAQEVVRTADRDPGRAPSDGERRALETLESTATRVARSGAIAAGIVGRMAVVNRRLIETLRRGDATYRSDGLSREPEVQGLRLEERV